MQIAKVYREQLPCARLIGKRYTNEERDAAGTFGSHWQQWYREDWFAGLQPCARIPGMEHACLGAMRVADGGFEYWIGALCEPDAETPAGFDTAELPAGELGVCWLRGDPQNGELFGAEATTLVMEAFRAQGWGVSETSWFFERYHPARYHAPDENGDVILDLCAYLTKA